MSSFPSRSQSLRVPPSLREVIDSLVMDLDELLVADTGSIVAPGPPAVEEWRSLYNKTPPQVYMPFGSPEHKERIAASTEALSLTDGSTGASSSESRRLNLDFLVSPTSRSLSRAFASEQALQQADHRARVPVSTKSAVLPLKDRSAPTSFPLKTQSERIPVRGHGQRERERESKDVNPASAREAPAQRSVSPQARSDSKSLKDDTYRITSSYSMKSTGSDLPKAVLEVESPRGSQRTESNPVSVQTETKTLASFYTLMESAMVDIGRIDRVLSSRRTAVPS